MANVFIDDSILQGMADLAREQSGTAEKLKPAAALELLRAGDGKAQFYDDYWDAILPTPEVLKNNFATLYIRNKKLFKPNKNIVIKQSEVFRDMNDTSEGLVDVPALCADLGFTVDYSKCGSLTYTHRSNTLFERLGEIDLAAATILNGTFQYMSSLHTIDKIRFYEGKITTAVNVFLGCKALIHLTVEGVIDFDFNLQGSPVSGASGISVLLHLKNFTGSSEEFSRTVYFNDATWERIEASEERPPDGSANWRDYTNNKGWNS